MPSITTTPAAAIAGVARPHEETHAVIGEVINLFSKEGDAALAKLVRARTLYAFDFDGTLAPIVERPDDARVSDRTTQLLARLALVAPTAIVSGRGVDDLKTRVSFGPGHLVGNHGAEGLPANGSARLADEHAAIVVHWQRQWDGVAAGLPEGVVIEPKALSLSIHYRRCDDPNDAHRRIGAAIAVLEPRPRVIGGKCVFNLLPEHAPDKGVALRRLVDHERCANAFFIGDDETDEAAFAIAPDHWVTVHVGDRKGTAARYFIPGQADVERCVDALLRHVEGAVRR